ncbi:MAG TPA: hypothetical protein VFG46_17940 [Chryseolinea sp.]|nr:hypothetical protein [Chryseolinea sp.]
MVPDNNLNLPGCKCTFTSYPGIDRHRPYFCRLCIVRENPQTTFIACHLANCEYKLVIISAANEVALVGSTMLALTAGGVFKDLNEASEKMLKGGKRIEPDKTATAVHDKRYSFFKKLREILGPLYREHAELRFEK